MSPYVVCLVTIDEIEKAANISKTLVEKRLAACANIIPKIRSIYRWKGQIHDESEVLIILKTRLELFDELKQAVKDLHPYETPEVIALNIQNGLQDYLDWIDDCTN